jgi:hypothetical protein
MNGVIKLLIIVILLPIAIVMAVPLIGAAVGTVAVVSAISGHVRPASGDFCSTHPEYSHRVNERSFGCP